MFPARQVTFHNPSRQTIALDRLSVREVLGDESNRSAPGTGVLLASLSIRGRACLHNHRPDTATIGHKLHKHLAARDQGVYTFADGSTALLAQRDVLTNTAPAVKLMLFGSRPTNASIRGAKVAERGPDCIILIVSVAPVTLTPHAACAVGGPRRRSHRVVEVACERQAGQLGPASPGTSPCAKPALRPSAEIPASPQGATQAAREATRRRADGPLLVDKSATEHKRLQRSLGSSLFHSSAIRKPHSDASYEVGRGLQALGRQAQGGR